MEDDLVFGNVDGTPMDPGTLTHNFARIARRAGLPGTRFHDLRHTFASLMLLAGVHPKIVSEALGHSSVAFTLDVYSHVVPGIQEAAAKRLDGVLELSEAKNVGKRRWRRQKTGENKAGVGGLEPPTCGFGDRCSSKLSYTPMPIIYIIINSDKN